MQKVQKQGQPTQADRQRQKQNSVAIIATKARMAERGEISAEL